MGDLKDQQTTGNVATPTLTGSVVVYSAGATPEDGIDMFISPDLREKLNAGVSGCQELNGDCVQKIEDLFNSRDTELQSRQILLYLAFAIGIAAILIGEWYFSTSELYNPKVPAHIHVHHAQITQAEAAGEATLTVVDFSSKAPFTITSKPQIAPFTTATQLPAVTQYTTEVGTHVKGDVVITLPSDFARTLDAFIRRSTECTPDSEYAPTVEKRTGNFVDIFCATYAVIINARPGGAFAELREFRPQAPLQFGGEDAIRALNAAMAFARGFAPQLKLSPEAAAAFATVVFAVVWQVNISSSHTLETENVIPANVLAIPPQITEVATTTATECEKCYASCTFAGALQRCGTACSTTTVCESTSTEMTIETTALTAYTVLPRVTAAPVPGSVSDLDTCDGGSSGLPYDIFWGIYDDFCVFADGEGVKSDFSRNVDNKGYFLEKKRRGLDGRSPPPNANLWSGWKAHLNFKVGDVSADCKKSCADSYRYLADGNYGKFGLDVSMSVKGSFNADCGTYSYELIPPAAPVTALTLSGQHCHAEDSWGKHVDVHARKQEDYARIMCDNIAFPGGENCGFGKSEEWKREDIAGAPEPYYFLISWDSTCTRSVTKQNKKLPIPDDLSVTCYDIMRGNFRDCNNKRAGGSRIAGCVRYDFRAETTS